MIINTIMTPIRVIQSVEPGTDMPCAAGIGVGVGFEVRVPCTGPENQANEVAIKVSRIPIPITMMGRSVRRDLEIMRKVYHAQELTNFHPLYVLGEILKYNRHVLAGLVTALGDTRESERFDYSDHPGLIFGKFCFIPY